MIAFISATPHHTWDAIVMAKKMFPNEKCDLYLCDNCDNFLDIAKRLEYEKIFEDIIPCRIKKLYGNDYKNRIIRSVKRTLWFIGWRGFLRKYAPIKKKKYSKVFLAGMDDGRCFMLTRFKQISPDVEPVYFEDGANDYLYDSHVKHQGKKTLLAKLVGLKYEIGYNIKKAYVLSPECVASSDYEYFSIPKIDAEKDNELKEILNRVFGYKHYGINEKAIYLFNRIPSVAERMEKIIKYISDKYGNNSIILKDHPRLPAEGYDGIKRIPKENEILWECMCLNNDFSDKVLISHCSTALFTPKFIFDQEPVMIFLFNMLRCPSMEKGDRRRSFEIFVEKLRGVYRDKSKVFLPNTEEELYEYLEKVMNKNG